MSDQPDKHRYFTEVARQIHAINQALVVIGLLAVVGIVALSEADRKFGEQDKINQEQYHANR
jgi:HD-like signal output (HDOD) protein